MPEGMSNGEAGGVITASAVFLGVVGKGVAWVFRQRKGRIARLEAKVEQISEVQAVSVRQNDCLVGVCYLLIDDISQHRPDAPIISNVRRLVGDFPELLRRLFPPEPVPIDMLALAARIKQTGES